MFFLDVISAFSAVRRAQHCLAGGNPTKLHFDPFVNVELALFAGLRLLLLREPRRLFHGFLHGFFHRHRFRSCAAAFHQRAEAA